MSRHYTIVESVGSHFESVHDYEDLEKHHPTQPENPGKRHYGDIDGRREEFVYAPGGERMVSKDFVLLRDGNAHVDIPSPLTGYVRRSERLDRWGTVEIYDGVGSSASLIGRVRHMEPILVANGERVECGQPLGRQGNKSPLGIRVGLHTHMDINEQHLSEFKSYLRDIDAGVITTDHYPNYTQNADAPSANHAPAGHADHVLDTRHAQHLLNKLGYRDGDGHWLVIDGEVGTHTRDAVSAFQHAHHLKADGLADMPTIDALRRAEHAPSPVDPCHQDHALYRQVLNGVHALDQTLGRTPDAASRQMAASLTLLAKENGLNRVDHVVLNEGSAHIRRGENIFIVQGRLDDPAHLRAHMKTQRAAETRITDVFHKIEALNLREQHEPSIMHARQEMLHAPAMQHAHPSLVP